MAIVIRINGNDTGTGFLLAPVADRTFPTSVSLSTDDGSTERVTLEVAPGGANVVLESNQLEIGPEARTVQIHATSESNRLNDTTLQVMVGGSAQARFALTAIADPRIHFQGRFQARFATDGDMYNHPWGTSAGWNFSLWDEPPFVPINPDGTPTPETIPQRVTDLNVGRVVRLNDPVTLRSHVPPVGVAVTAIAGVVGRDTEQFTVGDPIIGLPVNLGPHSYFAANNRGPLTPEGTTTPPPEEDHGAGVETMANFEFHLGNIFSGTSKLGPYRGEVRSQNPRDPDDRPKSQGLFAADGSPFGRNITRDTTFPELGIISLNDFDRNRLALLQQAFDALFPAEQVGRTGQNLIIRMQHLNGKLAGTLFAGYYGMEPYVGKINEGIQVARGDTLMLRYLASFNEFDYLGQFFNYHSDEQCGQVLGRISASPPIATA